MAATAAPDPFQLRPHGLEFKDLQDLSEYLDRIQEDAGASLERFRDSQLGGYQHQVPRGQEATKSSKASTATCLAYLQASGQLDEGALSDEQRKALRDDAIDTKGLEQAERTWTSAGLPDDNVFTVSFILETIRRLGSLTDLEDGRDTTVNNKIAKLNEALTEDKGDRGGLSIDRYPPTAFLTYKAIRVLKDWKRLDPTADQAASDWTWKRLYEESMVIDSGGPDADYFELAYLVLVASATAEPASMSPRKRRLLQHAIRQFFSGQRSDGTWPRSRPLFNYPDIGYAYCYDYELLVALLSDRQLTPWLLPHLDDLRSAAWALDGRKIPLDETDDGGRPVAWSSEHHAGNSEPESWSTACVFHFCFELNRLVAGAARRDVFEYVEARYEEPKEKVAPIVSLSGLLDSPIEYADSRRENFKAVFESRFLQPLMDERRDVEEGRAFSGHTSISAIMYGPPGTSKTKLAEMVAGNLGWPLLALDPSHLTRHGLDNVHAEANSVFGRLELCDQVVVLLDEFDELVREREETGDLTSRFLTTAMLPKIAALHDRRRIVYLVATNHLEVFDAAISRPGRFDVIVPLMPPTAEEKLAFTEKFQPLADAYSNLEGPDADAFKEAIEGLTFGETEDLCKELKPNVAKAESLSAAQRKAAGATLNRPVSDSPSADPRGDERKTAGLWASLRPARKPETWQERIASQREKIRGLEAP